MGYGPVITAIDEGHYERSGKADDPMRGKCHTCKTQWPCPTMAQAMADQKVYAEKLSTTARHQHALSLREVTTV